MVVRNLGRALAPLLLFPSAALALGLGDIRLNSSLNAPLDAEIELIGATQEELASLKAQIASRDTFARYGLDWPAYLGGIAVRQTRTPDGREVLHLRSAETITEPFVTLLVEVNWARGRLVREYTMLFDPPVYTPGESSISGSLVAAPAAGDEARGGAIERSAAPRPAPAEQPTDGSAASAQPMPAAAAVRPAEPVDPESYTVRRGDTLSRIAAQYAAGSAADARRWMLAIFQANPRAFDGNMNVLRSGAVLRIPEEATVAAIGAADASAEVRRQYAAWRGSSAATPQSESGQLRLVTPSDPAGGATAAGSSAEIEALRGRVTALEAELGESRRLLELRNAELARLQAELAAQAAGAGAPPATATSAASSEPAAPPAGQSPASVPVAEQEPLAPPPSPDEELEIGAAPDAAQQSAAAASEPTPARPARRAAAAAQSAEAEPSSGFLDSLFGLWGLVGLLAAAMLGLLGLRMWRSRQQAAFDDSLGRLAAAGAESLSREPVTEPVQARAAFAPAAREDAFLVEESGTHERPRIADVSIPAAAAAATADDTISSESAINLDQGDPLAEADFHMAYGLYDQAADLVRIAISREPERRDLKLKLLEVFFVWGNKDQFLQTARELAESRSRAAPGEWEKIVIMGKQLAPEDPLFTGGAGVSGAAAGGVDLDLEGGQNRVDFDLLGEPIPAEGAEGPEGIDLDIGSALADTESTGEAPALQATDRNRALDELPGGAGSATTREMTAALPREAEEPMLPEDYDFAASEAPTVEQPALHAEGATQTVRQKVETALRQSGGAGERTAELAIEDLGLDLSALEQQADEASPADAPTLVAGLDERSRQIMEEAERRASGTQTELTGSWQFDSDDLGPTLPPSRVRKLEPAEPASDASPTSRLAGLEGANGGANGVDFDLGADDALATSTNGAGVDLDVGTATIPDASFAATQRLSSEDLALPDLEPVTMSEVGTKLDLARAYMDMGDPEGARNILEEVLHEGSVAQKQEAQRLIEALPG